ncbi:MAG: glycosyltransferase [Ignavibacteriae bacterium]|nr:glycosyltransferase [Ignavibacteriota bacterium]
MTDVSIVIVNYNVKDLVDNCISSIYKANTENHSLEVFLVDNNSIDGSAQFIREKYSGVEVIENEENVGFSKANNVALRKASGKYILILNPDTILEEGTYSRMIRFCEENPDAGAVTSKLILANGQLDSACKRSFPTPSVAIPRMLGLSKLFPNSRLFGRYNLTYLDENKTHVVDAICGAFMFIPKTALDKAGLFDEDYFMYGEDLDLCFRITKSGYRIYYYPDVTTIHLKGSSTQKTNISYVNNFYGAMDIFVRKNFTGVPKLLSWIIRIGIFFRSFVSYVKRTLKNILYPLTDLVFLFISLVLSVRIRFDIFPNEDYLFIISVYILVWLTLLMLFGNYSRKRLSLLKTFNAVLTGFFVNSSITYFFNEYAFSRGVILISTVISIIMLIGWRSVVLMYNFFKSKNILLNKVNLLVVGNRELTQDTEEKLVAKYNVIYFNDISEKRTVADLREAIIINNIHEVVFSEDTFSNQEILNTISSFKDRNIQFKIVPSGKELILSKLTSNIDDISLIEIEYNINNKLNIFLKRVFDIVLSFIMLLTVYPFIFIYSNIFKGKLGRHISKLKDLPKVFIGKMSFVGIPEWFKIDGKEYLGKRGLTGLIQINFYDGMSDDEMANYNVFYAKNQSLMLDVEILLKTFFSFLKK